MNGKDAAEQFNAELDRLFTGGQGAAAAQDPAAIELAGKLARANFSADSKIREELRARLLAVPPAEAVEQAAQPFRLFFRTLLPVAFAAACVLLVVLPVVRRNSATPPAAPASAQSALPEVPRREAGPAPRRAALHSALPAAAAEPAGGESLFRAIPMAGLDGKHPQEFPIETRKEGFPITVQEGRTVAVPDGTDMVWETEDAVFTIEQRVTSEDEFFQRKSL